MNAVSVAPDARRLIGRRVAAAAARVLALGAAALAMQLATASVARAQFFVSPLVGYDTGADTGCLNLLICADRHLNVGVGAGRTFGRFGAEVEVAHAPDYFGSATDLSSYVLTAMANAVFSRPIGRWELYGIAGVGLMRTRIQFTQATFYATDQNAFAWNLGGGVTRYIGSRWGVRGDLRYFRSFREVALSGFTLENPKLGFGRVSAGVLLRL